MKMRNLRTFMPGFRRGQHPSRLEYRKMWWIFTSVVLGTLMVNIDSSVVNVLIPTLERAFHRPPSLLQWDGLRISSRGDYTSPSSRRTVRSWQPKEVLPYGCCPFHNLLRAVCHGYKSHRAYHLSDDTRVGRGAHHGERDVHHYVHFPARKAWKTTRICQQHRGIRHDHRAWSGECPSFLVWMAICFLD